MNAHVVIYYRFLTFLAEKYKRPMAQYGYYLKLQKELNYVRLPVDKTR